MADVIELTGYVRVVEVRQAPAPPITPIAPAVDPDPDGQGEGGDTEPTSPPPPPLMATLNLGGRELQVNLPEGYTAAAGDPVTVAITVGPPTPA